MIVFLPLVNILASLRSSKRRCEIGGATEIAPFPQRLSGIGGEQEQEF